MVITDIAAPPAGAPAGTSSDNYLTHGRGVKSWLLTLDHKRIGILYLVSVLVSFLLGGIYAELIRTKLITPGPSMVSANAYNQLFTIHGAVMIFMFLIPGIPAALGNFVLPLMLGAKDVAFPRLNLVSYYLLARRGPVLRRHAALRRPGHRLDLLHAVQRDHRHPRLRWPWSGP